VTGPPLPAYLVRGEDPSLVAQAVRDVLAEAADGRDPAMVVEEHGTGTEEIEVGAVVDALTTPPFIVDRRVVVVREAGRLNAGDAARLAAWVEAPVEGVVLVAAAGGGTVPAGLVRAVEKAGRVVDTNPGTGRARTDWLADHLRHGPVRLDARAASTLGSHLGNDLGRLQGLLEALASAYGEGASIDEERLDPFLGEAGSLAPWELTDAIDKGRTEDALGVLARMSGAGGMHPLAVLALLHRHVQAMLRLDGSTVTSAEEAAQLLGWRSAYPARKALEQGRRLGSARIGRAVVLLAEADLDLRGRSGLDDGLVLEVLVARLARLAASADSGARRGRRVSR